MNNKGSLDLVDNQTVTNLDFFKSLPNIGSTASKLIIQNCMKQATGFRAGGDCDCACGDPPEFQSSKCGNPDCDCTCTAPQCEAISLKIYSEKKHT